MAAAERLALLITANGSQAISEFQKTGAAAQTSLGKTNEGMARMGTNLVKVGAGMAAFGGIALAGLYKAAQAAQEEDLAIAKLNNSISQSPELAGASSAAFLDQAAALQDVTTFADDATISAQAMLATFHLTQDEILGLTPLVQDLAAKFDMDLVQASKLVGKAMDGNAGALARTGVRIDEAAFATDRYSAVMAALRENAGGFARQEGATFNGQLQILKNNLGDVSEGLGRGAVQAFNSLLGPVKAVSNAFQELSPEMQGTIGKFATFGSVGLVAVGSATMLVGSLMKVRAAYVTVQAAAKAAAEAEGVTAGTTSGIAGMGVAATAATAAFIAAAAGLAIWGNSMVGAKHDAEEFATGTADEMREAARVAAAVFSDSEIKDTLEDFFAVDPGKAQQFGDMLITAGASAEVVNGALEEQQHAAELAAMGLDEHASSADEAAAQMQQLTRRIDQYVNRVNSVEEAQDGLQGAFQDLYTTMLENGQGWRGNTEAARENRAAMRGVVAQAAETISTMQEQNASEERMQSVKERSINTLIRARNAGLLSATAFQRLTSQINGIPTVPPLNVTIYGAETAIGQLQRISQEALTAAHNVGQISGSLAGGGSFGRSLAPGAKTSSSPTPMPRRAPYKGSRDRIQNVVVVGAM